MSAKSVPKPVAAKMALAAEDFARAVNGQWTLAQTLIADVAEAVVPKTLGAPWDARPYETEALAPLFSAVEHPDPTSFHANAEELFTTLRSVHRNADKDLERQSARRADDPRYDPLDSNPIYVHIKEGERRLAYVKNLTEAIAAIPEQSDTHDAIFRAIELHRESKLFKTSHLTPDFLRNALDSQAHAWNAYNDRLGELALDVEDAGLDMATVKLAMEKLGSEQLIRVSTEPISTAAATEAYQAAPESTQYLGW